MAVLAEVEDIASPGVSRWVILSTDSCGSVQDTFDDITPEDRVTAIKSVKPAPSGGQRWEVDLNCLTTDPLWQVARNPDGSLSTYIYAPIGVTRKVRLTKLNTVPASDPVTVTAVYGAAGHTRTGFINPANPPKYATLHGSVANASYRIELLNESNESLDSKTIPVTTSGPELSFYAANATPETPGDTFEAGSSETYTGTLVQPQGLATHPDKSVSVTGYSAGKATMLYTGSYSPPSGKELRFFLGGENWLTLAQFNAYTVYAGTIVMVLIVEITTGNTDNSTYISNSPFQAETSLIIH